MARELRIDYIAPEAEWYIGEAGYAVIDYEVNQLHANAADAVFNETVSQLAAEGWSPLRIQVYEEPQYDIGIYTSVIYAVPSAQLAQTPVASLIVIDPATWTLIVKGIIAAVIGVIILLGLVVLRDITRIAQPVLFNLTGGPLSFIWPIVIGAAILGIVYILVTQPARRTGISTMIGGVGERITPRRRPTPTPTEGS